MALNRTAPRSYRMEATTDEATVYLYDVIGFDFWTGEGITAKQFAKDLSAITAPVLHLRFNSPGGDVFEGRAMVAALNQFPGKIIAHIDGLAASAASFVAMHAHEIEMTEGAFLMIHNGWTIAMGDRHVFLDAASLLEQIDASIVEDYRARTGGDAAEIAAMMDAETWINAQDAVERGFADRIAVPAKATEAQARWNLSAYQRPPPDLAEAPVTEPISEQPDHAHAERVRRFALLTGNRAA